MNSFKLIESAIPYGDFYEGLFRSVYLTNYHLCEPPTIASSSIVPRDLVINLMRNKKDLAIAVKYVKGDAITNMEGALHSLVTPIVKAHIQGDYIYKDRHLVPRFTGSGPSGMQLARPVIVSCLVQPDFEFDNVMFELIKLGKLPIEGKPYENYVVPTALEKQNDEFRRLYDLRLKQHLVFYTLGRLPACDDADLSDTIVSNGCVLSLKLLRAIMTCQLQQELRAISLIAPQGFIYTWDPPAIFARYLDATVLNTVWVDAMVMALKDTTCKLVAFNDYADSTAIEALGARVAVPVVSKASIFPHGRLFSCVQDWSLVIHNNSDGFGQNIEREEAYGSLDGAIGSGSSTAASLVRSRPDLVDHIFL